VRDRQEMGQKKKERERERDPKGEQGKGEDKIQAESSEGCGLRQPKPGLIAGVGIIGNKRNQVKGSML
jgi:hypothetical protein